MYYCILYIYYIIYYLYFPDYDAPITESGDYTEKYYSTAIKILEYDPISSLVSHPDPPEIVPPTKYGDVQITEQMDYEDILSNVVSEQAIHKSIYVPSFNHSIYFIHMLLDCNLIPNFSLLNIGDCQKNLSRWSS